MTTDATDPPDPDFDELLAFLREHRGVDFAGYKPTSLRRLVTRRMRDAGSPDLRHYLDRLQVDPPEITRLFDGLLINVTSFFRDPGTWEQLRTHLVPELLAALPDDAPLRLWSAACATGEEAYSLAMLMHELLGDDAYRERVKIYATDVDEPALAVARTGRYAEAALEALTPEQRETYFPQQTFRADLRQNIIFGRHDLLADAPISRVCLLACRNALMYFTAETQGRVLERFAFALDGRGLLLLGRAEMLLTYSDVFFPVDLPRRVFRTSRPGNRMRLSPAPPPHRPEAEVVARLGTAAFLEGPQPQLVLADDTSLQLVNDEAVRRLGVSRQDLGRPFAELELSRRPVDLLAVVSEVLHGGRPQLLQDVSWSVQGGSEHWWTVQVAALGGEGGALGVQLNFLDVTRAHALSAELQTTHTALQGAHEQLQSSSEELATMNEELQSAIEELETTNEELQSTNEELETMNEELQSTNEELQTVNDELRERTLQISEVNGLLEGILSGLRSAVTVVDVNRVVLAWNARSELLFGLRSYEAEGVPLGSLEGSLPLAALSACADRVLASGEPTAPLEIRTAARLGGELVVLLSGTPLRDGTGRLRGAVLTMDEFDAAGS